MDEAVTLWLRQLAQGDELAAQRIWERYYDRLVRLARKKLGGHKRRVADEEDVVLSAFQSFCQAAAAGRFPRLEDQHDLWKLLVTITAQKAIAQIRRELLQKHGGGAVRGESVFFGVDDAARLGGIHEVLGEEPSPELAVIVGEQCERLLDRLQDESLRAIAVYKLEGYDNTEIARKLKCARRTVERKLNRIRQKWEKVEP